LWHQRGGFVKDGKYHVMLTVVNMEWTTQEVRFLYKLFWIIRVTNIDYIATVPEKNIIFILSLTLTHPPYRKKYGSSFQQQ
jgi:hypothetical protein